MIFYVPVFGQSLILGTNYAYGLYPAGFSKIPEVNGCCPKDYSGSGSGFGLTANYIFYKYNDWEFGSGVSYIYKNPDMNAYEEQLISINDKPYNGKIKYNLNLKLNYLSPSLNISYKASSLFHLDFSAYMGLNFKSNFSSYESIDSPADRGVFIDTKTRTRNTRTGELTSVNKMIYGASLAISSETPLNMNYKSFLKPYLAFDYNFNSLLKDYKINNYGIRIGLAVKYNFYNLFIPETPAQEIPISKENIILPSLSIFPYNSGEPNFNSSFSAINNEIEINYLTGEKSKINKTNVVSFSADTLAFVINNLTNAQSAVYKYDNYKINMTKIDGINAYFIPSNQFNINNFYDLTNTTIEVKMDTGNYIFPKALSQLYTTKTNRLKVLVVEGFEDNSSLINDNIKSNLPEIFSFVNSHSFKLLGLCTGTEKSKIAIDRAKELAKQLNKANSSIIKTSLESSIFSKIKIDNKKCVLIIIEE